MAKQSSSSDSKVVSRVFMYLSLASIIPLMAVFGAAWWANNLISNQVRDELGSQKIYFPEKGSPGFDAETYPDLQKYAGELVDSPDEAKAYANGYIGRHLKDMANGMTYSEASAASRKDPTNQELAQQVQTLFRGETLRSILLTSGYGFGTIGQVAGYISWAALAGAGLMVLLAIFFRIRSL